MILEQLEKLEHADGTDGTLARYILKHQREVCHMTIREMSEAIFVSVATIVRFTKKLGCKGFKEFKIQLNVEVYAGRGALSRIDADFPIHENERINNLIDVTLDLKVQAIEKTKELMRKNGYLGTVIREAAKSTGIDIYGQGFAIDAGTSFRNHMNRIGYNVFLDTDISRQTNWAARADKKHFSIILSYSGETEVAVTVAKILRKRKMKSFSITCEGQNHLAKYTTWNQQIAPMETRLVYTKVSSISSDTAFGFVLDTLYMGIFSQNYENNVLGIQNSINIQKAVEDEKN